MQVAERGWIERENNFIGFAGRSWVRLARCAAIAIAVAQGYREATTDELLGDTNHDGRITIDDVAAILQMIEAQ